MIFIIGFFIGGFAGMVIMGCVRSGKIDDKINKRE